MITAIKNDKEREAAYKKLYRLFNYANDEAKIEFAKIYFLLYEYDGREPKPAIDKPLKS